MSLAAPLWVWGHLQSDHTWSPSQVRMGYPYLPEPPGRLSESPSSHNASTQRDHGWAGPTHTHARTHTHTQTNKQTNKNKNKQWTPMKAQVFLLALAAFHIKVSPFPNKTFSVKAEQFRQRALTLSPRKTLSVITPMNSLWLRQLSPSMSKILNTVSRTFSDSSWPVAIFTALLNWAAFFRREDMMGI